MLDQLDGFAWNKFHSRACVALGLGWGMDAFEVTLIGSILGVLGPLWHLSGLALSAILGVWFAGIMVGAVGFGILTDRYGRRMIFLASLMLYGVATFFTAFTQGIGGLLFLRFMAGVGVGAEYAAVNAAIAELMPSAKRGFAASFVMNFWSVGTLLAALLAWLVFAFLPADDGWRLIFASGGVVALATLWLRRQLPESPRWLISQGRNAEAAAIIQAVGRGEALCTSPIAAQAQAQAQVQAEAQPLTQAQPIKTRFWTDFRSLIARHKSVLALGCVLDFAEAGGYYGLFAFLPLAVLPNLHLGATALPPFYMAGSLGALLGGIIVSLLLDRLGRKPVVSFFYGATALACLGFAKWVNADIWVLGAGFVLVNMLATASWVGAYPTFSELFPTRLRATGIGISVAVGRIGAIISPFLMNFAGKMGLAPALAVLAGFWLIGFLAMLVWWFVGIEANGVPLERLNKLPA